MSGGGMLQRSGTEPHLLAAGDKFRGTLTAAQFAAAVAAAARAQGASYESVAMADGGEGLLEVFGTPNRHVTVTDALGRSVEAAWWCGEDGTAVVESARSNGLELVGGARSNDPIGASTAGVGELLAAALSERPRQLVVGVGGSATTDGGLGAVQTLERRGLLTAFATTEVVVACDVTTRYTDAARVFGPQKGADAAQIEHLTGRLRELRARFTARFGVDPERVPGGGAAGGLAGGLAVLGARLEPGADIVARRVGLDDAVARADLVVTGEGRLDATSVAGKVVGAVAVRARAASRPLLVVCGAREPGVDVPGATVVALVERFGEAVALTDTAASVTRVVADHLVELRRRREPLVAGG